jgi:hypothetical protein
MPKNDDDDDAANGSRRWQKMVIKTRSTCSIYERESSLSEKGWEEVGVGAANEVESRWHSA